MASLYHLANGNHHPDPLIQSALRSASLRFHESHRSAPLFLDPYCGCFLSPDTAPPSASTPYRLATKFIDEELMNRMMSDDELRQVVLFTDGMDTRPFRLNWPRSSAIYDVSPGSVFQFASQRLQDVGAKISRTCMLLHVPSESSNIQEHLCEKGFNGNRPSVWALQGLPLMSSACFNDLLFLVSCLAMKGSIFLGVLPGCHSEVDGESFYESWLSSEHSQLHRGFKKASPRTSN